jgi:hypothetical protein
VTWEVAVRVTFVQSGGVVGVPRRCELDSSLLAPGDALELESLVAESGLVASGEFLSARSRDLRLYEIQVESDTGSVSVTFDDQTLPERARPLLSFLRRNAKPRGGA